MEDLRKAVAKIIDQHLIGVSTRGHFECKGYVKDMENEFVQLIASYSQNTFKVNRFEVVDYLRGGSDEPYLGRFTRWEDKPFEVDLSLQDDNRTLKVFLKDKAPGGGSDE